MAANDGGADVVACETQVATGGDLGNMDGSTKPRPFTRSGGWALASDSDLAHRPRPVEISAHRSYEAISNDDRHPLPTIADIAALACVGVTPSEVRHQ